MSISVKQAISDFLLSRKVEGKSYGTIECYQDKALGMRLRGINWLLRWICYCINLAISGFIMTSNILNYGFWDMGVDRLYIFYCNSLKHI